MRHRSTVPHWGTRDPTAGGDDGQLTRRPVSQVLPTWLSHVIVLDTDLFLFSDIAGLWAEFAHFEPTQLLGLAAEQCPSYQEVRRRWQELRCATARRAR